MANTNINVLFSQVRAGDTSAFEVIYEELKQPVFTICWRIVQSKELAEDLTHDVFVRLFTSPPDDTVRNTRAWVFQMAHNLAIDALRKQHPTTDVGELTTDDCSRIHLRMDLELALKKLSYIEREIVALHLNAGLQFIEIARIVQMSLPATYRRYRHALLVLQSELNGGRL